MTGNQRVFLVAWCAVWAALAALGVSSNMSPVVWAVVVIGMWIGGFAG